MHARAALDPTRLDLARSATEPGSGAPCADGARFEATAGDPAAEGPTASPIDPTGEVPRPARNAVSVPTPRDPAAPIDPTGEIPRPARNAVSVPTPRDPAAPIAALIRGGQHRDALAACAREHGAVLGRLCMALLGSQADADEAIQETLLRAHRGMASYRGEGSVKSWLCGIARHVCVHMLESRRRGRDAAERAELPEDSHDAFASRRRARAIRAGLDQLRPSEREALVLRYVTDLSHREIAATLQIDEAAARKRISRALAHLRTALCDQEID